MVGLGQAGFWSRQGATWCAQDRCMAKLIRARQSSRARDIILVSRPRFKVATWFGLEGVATWPIGGGVVPCFCFCFFVFVVAWPVEIGVATPF